MKKIIKLTESELKNIIKEIAIKTINEERNTNYNYKNADKRRKVAQHLNKKTPNEKHQEWSDIIAKRTAIRDINHDRDWENLPQHEKDFTRATNSDTFNKILDVCADFVASSIDSPKRIQSAVLF